MAKIIEKTGKTVEDALNAALEELGVAAEDIEYEILETPSKGLFFGIGAKPAKIQVKLKEIPVEIPTENPAPVKNFEAKVEEKIESAESEKIETETAEVENIPAEEIKSETENIATEEIKPEFDKEKVIATAKNFLAEVFAAMKIEVEINTVENDSEVVLDLIGKDLGVLIGKHGQTLDSLQYLVNLAANSHDSEEKVYFVLDVENYRNRRATALKKLAKSVAERAIRTRQDVKLEPMSRTERKVIHTALQENSKVETHSAGEDPYRYIIVSPKKKRQ